MRENGMEYDSDLLTLSVIGYCGTCQLLTSRVGKSTLIDQYINSTSRIDDHSSIISYSDFNGDVICGDHWLFWGEKWPLRIMEQCEFVDDHLFQPIHSTISYIDRCLETKYVVSIPKLRYYCKTQLGVEDSFPKHYLKPGIYPIDVFMCVYDTTLSQQAALDQGKFIEQVLYKISRSKLNLPLVLVTSKHDSQPSPIALQLLSSALKKLKKRWIRTYFSQLEVSSRQHINVDSAFQVAAQLACAIRRGEKSDYCGKNISYRKFNSRSETAQSRYI
ncbi:unnamed protein product [Protopolystoma xenopodis]|uniref:Uncharacterized protein n=1 Tax=Protopolystoma xenopodis TaxID=117903 RepID=A0A448X5J7_9PLAT|nr:unnamed protein product [Protopolystoma xenopodis]